MDWVAVHAAPNEVLARLAAGLLGGHGWPVLVRPTGIPHMGPAGPHEVLVPRQHAAAARRILASRGAGGGARPRRRRAGPGSGSPWPGA